MVHKSGIPMMEMVLTGLRQFDINYYFTFILYLTVSIAYMKKHMLWGIKRDFMGICKFETGTITVSVKKNLSKFL